MSGITYNMGFKINDLMLELNLVKDLLLAGYEVKRLSKSAYSVMGVSEPWRERIEKVSNKFWHF